jgi:GTP-binding protein
MAEDLDLEAGRKLFAGPCDFMLGVADVAQLPPSGMPEIALAGRSNVGKSSLVNALTSRSTLAKTSNTPGRTQQLNYFNLGDRLYMVDMPGYGYARVSHEQVDEWHRLIRAYLRGRQMLRCVLVLVDARHGLKDSDEEIMKMLDECAVSYRVILTKADKVKTQELEKVSAETLAGLKKRIGAYPAVLATSAEKGHGLAELRAIIAGYGL